MFEQSTLSAADDAYYARQAALLDAVDEYDVIGHEPVVPPAPSDADICAEVATGTTALSPALLPRLDFADLDALDAVAAVDAAIAFDRVANRVSARRLRAIAVAVRRQVGTERVDPIRLASAELGAALRVGTRSINSEITIALDLTTRLTRTLAAMESGAVSYGKARVLVDETIDLVDEKAQAVEAHVLDAARGAHVGAARGGGPPGGRAGRPHRTRTASQVRRAGVPAGASLQQRRPGGPDRHASDGPGGHRLHGCRRLGARPQSSGRRAQPGRASRRGDRAVGVVVPQPR
jgi:hypothetical protein